MLTNCDFCLKNKDCVQRRRVGLVVSSICQGCTADAVAAWAVAARRARAAQKDKKPAEKVEEPPKAT